MTNTPAQHAETLDQSDRIEIGDTYYAEPGLAEDHLYALYLTAMDPSRGPLPEHAGDITREAAMSWRHASLAAHHFADKTHHLIRALDAAGECVSVLEQTVEVLSRALSDLVAADAADMSTTHPDEARQHARELLDALADLPQNDPTH